MKPKLKPNQSLPWLGQHLQFHHAGDKRQLQTNMLVPDACNDVNPGKVYRAITLNVYAAVGRLLIHVGGADAGKMPTSTRQRKTLNNHSKAAQSERLPVVRLLQQTAGRIR